MWMRTQAVTPMGKKGISDWCSLTYRYKKWEKPAKSLSGNSCNRNTYIICDAEVYDPVLADVMEQITAEKKKEKGQFWSCHRTNLLEDASACRAPRAREGEEQIPVTLQEIAQIPTYPRHLRRGTCVSIPVSYIEFETVYMLKNPWPHTLHSTPMPGKNFVGHLVPKQLQFHVLQVVTCKNKTLTGYPGGRFMSNVHTSIHALVHMWWHSDLLLFFSLVCMTIGSCCLWFSSWRLRQKQPQQKMN